MSAVEAWDIPARRNGMERLLQAGRLQVARKPIAPVGSDGHSGLEGQVEPVKAEDEVLVIHQADG